ncbi:HD domain-containing protein [Methanoculleus sp. FWC-SCC1]|uniref:HD domain-containing protein n=1 Tax=Methanoculleus frigidifontis TaxID=2584085 RepID=A0ABT8M6Z9_9EURY|nr:HD domain-containing protein [Methanoculleus sp. FWC-SCC1]MDN7023709.1 HD domain-containing protein [Methanoculleus sp. FWC-SCC1]
MDEPLEEIRDYVRTVFRDAGAHGLDHVQRVTLLCEALGAREGADMSILIPAALFHDIARPREEETGVPHEEEGARMAESFLRSIGYPDDRIAGIAHAIRAHRYSTGIAPETLEAQILSDADKLDAMGAVGIARTFMQAGERGGGIADATGHFHEKLLQLSGRMYTESARVLAQRRHAFLAAFLEALDDETDGTVTLP